MVNEKNELNCLNINKACESTAMLLNIEKQLFVDRLLSYTPDQYEEDCCRIHLEPELILWKKILGNQINITPASIIWFHATRVLPNTDFSEGILPLNEKIDDIKKMLKDFSLSISIPNNQISEHDDSILSNYSFLYAEKSNNSIHWGPYAFLTRDAIIDPECSTVRYLNTPEIIEDLAHVMFKNYAETILDYFRKMTIPCIIHFRDYTPRDDVMLVALAYC